MIGQIIKVLIVAMLMTVIYTFIRVVKLIIFPLIKATCYICLYMFIIFFYYGNKIIIIILSTLLKGLIAIQTFIYNKYLIMYGGKKNEDN